MASQSELRKFYMEPPKDGEKPGIPSVSPKADLTPVAPSASVPQEAKPTLFGRLAGTRTGLFEEIRKSEARAREQGLTPSVAFGGSGAGEVPYTTTTLPQVSTEPTAPRIGRRGFLKMFGVGLGTAALATGAGALLVNATGGSETQAPTPAAGVGPGLEPGNGGPSATATETQAATATPPVLATEGPKGPPIAAVTPQSTDIPRAVNPLGSPPATPGTPGVGTPGTPRIEGTPNPTKAPESTATTEVKKPRSFTFNVLQPGNPEIEQGIGPMEASPLSFFGLYDQFRGLNGETPEQMFNTVSDYSHAATRYSNEWWEEQVKNTGRHPTGRPTDIGLDNPIIQKYMKDKEPYKYYVWQKEALMQGWRLPTEGTIDPELGFDLNVIVLKNANDIDRMRESSVPVSTSIVFRYGVTEGKLSGNIFATAKDLIATPDRMNNLGCLLLNALQNVVIIRNIREGTTPKNFTDQNLVNMFYSPTKSPDMVNSSMIVGNPLRTPLLTAK